MNNERIIKGICFRKKDNVWLAVGDTEKAFSITETETDTYFGLKIYIFKFKEYQPLMFLSEDKAFECVSEFIHKATKK